MTQNTHRSSRLATLLLVGASGLALAVPAQANELLYSTKNGPLETGTRLSQSDGLTQVSLTGGGTASFVDEAEYQINEDGSIELYSGSVTVAGTQGRPVMVRMPEGLEGQVSGRGSSANFSVGEDGEAAGHALTGEVQIGTAGRMRQFEAGAMWRASAGGPVRRVIANTAQAAPDAASQDVEPIGGDAGPVKAAMNGIPVTLGDALAAAGASSDILGAARRVELAVGNPVLETFPSGDLALLVARAVQIEGSFGGTPFPQAQADIIRAYLRFLASGGSGAQFLTTFSSFSLDYLDLIRAGGVPSGFASASVADINAYLDFINRTGALSDLAARDRVLADAYLEFLRNGGNPDLFAGSFTDLTTAYFAFVRAGNAPGEFGGASAAAIQQTIAFLSQSGLVEQLNSADRALVAAFLDNGGLAFASQFETALTDYFAFLASGQLPSAYEPLDQATLLAYLETLSDTGLLDTVLGDQAGFYADYLAFLRAGGDVDGFAALPANIFAGYAAQLSAYRAFLDAGNLPSGFAGADPAQLQAFIAQLQAAGALERFVGGDAAFFAAFSEFVAGGGAFDAFAGLNGNIFAGYATQLQAYFAFLENGGVPSTYQPLSQAVIAEYLAALQAAGATARFLPELGDFYGAYFAFVTGGGNPDNFAGLPVPPDFGAFAAALNAYADFLAAGGFPADFNGQDLSTLASFIEALGDAGELQARLGVNADLLSAYFAFLQGGGAPNAFTGLPIYADYVTALNAYFAFLEAGGLPADYTVLDQATLNAYLAALSQAGGLAAYANLDGFFTNYFAFISGGGDPANFAGLPVFADYVAALNAYLAFLEAGGLPSEYTVLDQATLNAYLAALASAQGGLDGFGDLDAFFIQFFAFLQGGGEPDQFAGLPANMGGGGGPTDPGNTPTLAYNGGFDGARPNIAYAGNGFNGERPQVEPLLARFNGFADANITEAGALQSYGGLISSTDTASVLEVSGDANLLIGRITDGTFQNRGRDLTLSANQGFHYLLARDITGGLMLPSGVIEYDLLAATRPTLFSGETAPGVFAANLAIEFGSRVRVGIDGTITMPGDSGFVYSFSSPGGSADPNANPRSLVIIDGGLNFSASGTTDEASPRSGSIDFQGFLGDPEANRLGVTYRASLSGADQISGAAIFGQAGDAGGTGGMNAPIETRTGQFTFVGNSGARGTGDAFYRDGTLIGFSAPAPFTSVADAANATISDAGSNDDMAWARWSNGPIRFNGGIMQTPATFSYHAVSGTPTQALPATGLLNYDLIETTTLTVDGSTQSGTLTGDMAIAFGSAPTVGLELSASFGAKTWSLATAGGVADPTQSGIAILQDPNFRFGASFNNISGTTRLSGTGGACSDICSINIEGSLFGSDANSAGVYVAIGDRDAGVTTNLQGLALFEASADGVVPLPGAGGGAAMVDGIVPTGTVNSPFAYAGSGSSEGAVSAATMTVTDGVLLAAERGSIRVSYSPTANSTIEVSGDQGVIGWQRINAVSTVYSGSTRQVFQSNPFVEQYWHTVWGAPLLNMPTMGLINFEFIGGSTAHQTNARAGSGIFSGRFAVDFATLNAGLEATVNLDGPDAGVFNFASTGGVAAPSMALRDDGFGTMRFSDTLATTEQGVGGVSRGTTVFGFLAGDGATHAGLTYRIRTSSSNSIMGTAAFRAGGVETATASQATASIAPSAAPIASIDMARWGGMGSGSLQGASAAVMDLLPPGITPQQASLPRAAQAREAAILQAERLMGGTITFARPGGRVAAE